MAGEKRPPKTIIPKKYPMPVQDPQRRIKILEWLWATRKIPS